MLGLLGDFMNRTLSRRPVLCHLGFTKGSHKPSGKDHNKRWHFCKNINMDILEAQRITEEVNLSSAKVNWRREPETSSLSHPHAYTLHAMLSTTTFAALGNGESHWTTCMKTRKKKNKQKNSGRAVGQKQARKMSQDKMMLLLSKWCYFLWLHWEDGGAGEGQPHLPSAFQLWEKNSEYKPHCKF